MPGVRGGEPGAPNKMVIRYGSEDPFVVQHTAEWVPIGASQRVMYDYGGGGGWGSPLDRKPQAGLDDGVDEDVSVEGAGRGSGGGGGGSLEGINPPGCGDAPPAPPAPRPGGQWRPG